MSTHKLLKPMRNDSAESIDASAIVVRRSPARGDSIGVQREGIRLDRKQFRKAAAAAAIFTFVFRFEEGTRKNFGKILIWLP